MSDSYSAYCEQMERDACVFSKENVNLVKNTAEFKKLLKQTKDAHSSTKLCEAKTCKNCIHRMRLNNNEVCKKLSIVLEDDNLVCKKWRGTLHISTNQKLNEDVIAWLIIQKHKFDYGR